MSLPIPNKKNTQGFTLIEVLITLLIICFGFLSLTNIQTVLLKSNVFAQQRTEAVMLAQNKLEKLKQTFFYNNIRTYKYRSFKSFIYNFSNVYFYKIKTC